ncbi:patatin-like phospholipase family protein [Niveibacterium umoris]|uniref:Putative acylesterase/phospholipase RssA n=1 Tax=Niveibacterium umoris TaxID=1193620 RepID=A0A840BMX6_9RHOO|nr:patatin-like phospholipase family protein [Niveibacterium umoris]MBB4012206.1 putative acylesterase/phospholipase RssA [Niveibacterium umoris]
MSPQENVAARKIGIALAGGGPLGGIYEVGAIAALAESFEGLDFNEADIYVGVSSGSFIAAALANGIAPMRLTHMLIDNGKTDEVFDPEVLLKPAFKEYWNRASSVPPLIWKSLKQFLSDPFDHGLYESFARLGRALPTGVFNNAGIGRFLSRLFRVAGRTNDFRKLPNKLFIVATDLDSGESVPFGSKDWDDVPIARAVQASSALPGLFPPVRVRGRYFVDGALIKTLHASVALKEGAKLVLCINPLVPFDAQLAEKRGAKERHKLVEGGLPVVLSQTFRAIIHSRMRTGMDRYQHQYPDADVVLFEPHADDAEMFFTNVFSYRDRHKLCEHAYQMTRRDLLRRRHMLRPVLARHGIRLRVDVLRDPHRTLLDEELPALEPARGLARVAVTLRHTLDELDAWLKARKA